MPLLLTEAEPRAGAVVSAVTSAAGSCVSHRLVVSTNGGQLACYACATTAPAASEGVHRLWQQPVSGGRLEHAAPLTSNPDIYLVITSHGATAQAQATLVAVPPPSSGGGTAASHRVLAQAPLGSQQHEQPLTPPTFSNLSPCTGSNGSTGMTLAVSLHQGTVHLVQAERSASGTWRLAVAANNLCDLLTTEPGASIVVESLALGPSSTHLAAAAAPAGSLHCAILYTSHCLGGGRQVTSVACLEASNNQLNTCCWFLRNVHPATCLVAALPGARMLVAGGSSLQLVESQAPQDKLLQAVQLLGRPTCLVALSGSLGVLGDSMGRLYLLDLQQLQVAPLASGLLAAAPTCLAYLPAPADGAGGVLFVGSSAGSSVFLEVPQAVVAAATGDGGEGSSSSLRRLAALPAWQPLPAVAGSAGQLSSLAPVSACQLISDPSGCGDNRLLMLCGGEAPFGRLALARLAAGLVPLAVGGGDLPGEAQLLGLKASPSAAIHRYLLLSSDAASASGGGSSGSGWTAVLEAGGGGLHAGSLPGLQLEAATLMAGPLPGGSMLQVTPKGAFVFRPASGAPQSSWHPPDGRHILLAAQQGQYVALGYGAEVQVLYCSGGTGRLQEERLLRLPQQASALALFQLGGGGGGGSAAEGGEVWVAAGLWLTNQVLLQPLSADQPACTVPLGELQPRSILVCQLGGGASGSGGASSTYLVVGTSSGELLWWRMAVQRDAFGGISGLLLEQSAWARAGVAPVLLHLLPPTSAAVPAAVAANRSGTGTGSDAGSGSSRSSSSSPGPCVLAVSDQALLLGPDAVHPARLAAARLHDGQGLTAACPLATDELPGSCLAWLHGGQLHMGCLEPAVQLRWDELALTGGAAASSAAYHAGSGCAAVACSEADGSSSLRLVDVAGMRQLASLALPAGHSITAVAVAPLPCSSRWDHQDWQGSGHSAGAAGGPAAGVAAPQQPQQQRQSQQQAGCKHFLLVAVAVDAGAPVDSSSRSSKEGPEAQLPVPLEAAGDGQPWWRQQREQQQFGAAGASDSGPEQQQQQQQQQVGQQADSGSPQQATGLLMVLEVRHRQLEAAGGCSSSGGGGGGGTFSGSGSIGGCSRAHELVLHGTTPLPAPLFSLATVQPETAIFEAGLPAASTAASSSGSSVPLAPQPPLLAAGCQDGTVRLYRVFVDDAGVEGRHAVELGLAAITAGMPPLRLTALAAAPAAAARLPAVEAGTAAQAGLREQQPADAAQSAGPPAVIPAGGGGGSIHGSAAVGGGGGRGLWHQHVALQLVAKAPTCFEGIPTRLVVHGSTVFALDLLSSLTVFRVQPAAAGQLASLLPLAADLTGRHITSVLPLSDTLLVAGVHGGGLLLLQRDLAAEQDRQAAARQRWERLRERGAALAAEGGEAAVGMAPQRAAAAGAHFVPSLRDAVQLDAVACHGTLSSICSVSMGRLGVPVRRAEELQGAVGGDGGGSEHQATATLVCTNGTVAACRLITPEQHQVLWQVQEAAELTAEGGGGGQLSIAPPLEAEGGIGGAAPAGCLDSGILSAAYSHPSWHQRLLKAAGPVVVHRGREILETLSLL